MTVRLAGEAWQEITLRLLTRSGGFCEGRTPGCLAGPDGRVVDRRDRRLVPVSRHHRLPRGAGGTSDAETNSLANLLLLCGDGVAGCHGFVESNRVWARARGLLVPRGQDPAGWPVTFPSGRQVLLDPQGGFYLDIGYVLPV